MCTLALRASELILVGYGVVIDGIDLELGVNADATIACLVCVPTG